MKLFSTGQVAKEFGVTRDDIEMYLRSGAPWSGNKAGRQRIYTEKDVKNLREWCIANGKIADEPQPSAIAE